MEEIYQYFWNHKIVRNKPLSLADGREFCVINPGTLNHDAGPDFTNARILQGKTTWAGNIEVHIKASDWYRHGHDCDPAYDNIILHVVGVNDKHVNRANGTPIPTYILRIPTNAIRLFEHFKSAPASQRCAPYFSLIPAIVTSNWLESLGLERLQSKAKSIAEINKSLNGDWEQTMFVIFARALGFGLNNDPFEMLAKSIPLKILHRHCDSLLQLEALLFGQAGLLDTSQHIFDEYYALLCREYYFLMRKYDLRPMWMHSWKNMRIRPQNHPHRRIALLAKACLGGFRMLNDIIEKCDDVEALRALFDLQTEGYWTSHHSLGNEGDCEPIRLSPQSVDLMLINVVAPLLYCYGSMRGRDVLTERAVDLQCSLKGEQNKFIRAWTAIGIKADNAFRSQALIHLSKNYCDERRCTECRLGHHLLRKAHD